MSELASALFSIADANEFRFARFYIVCEAVPLGTLESPLIVCGLSDTLRESPNVAKTRNQMQSSGWKKYTHFFQTNVSYAVPPEICIICFPSCNITYYSIRHPGLFTLPYSLHPRLPLPASSSLPHARRGLPPTDPRYRHRSGRFR